MIFFENDDLPLLLTSFEKCFPIEMIHDYIENGYSGCGDSDVIRWYDCNLLEFLELISSKQWEELKKVKLLSLDQNPKGILLEKSKLFSLYEEKFSSEISEISKVVEYLFDVEELLNFERIISSLSLPQSKKDILLSSSRKIYMEFLDERNQSLPVLILREVVLNEGKRLLRCKRVK